ncbi:MAG: RNA 2',3'-cyclic phosphodiesterase [Candidatus Omnitrophica bacterium]|nr:RNA 2',3'-cyclic phosphodiesterase [Candidatus Omnitrophota bacterium]
MAETIRAFIAVELNDQVKETIREFQAHLKPLGCDIAWVKPENVHLTLKFLGEVKTKRLPSVIETLEDVCRDLRPFDTALTQPGVFPDLRHPRVVWIGLEDTGGDLARMAESLETALGNTGFKKERRDFQAHITVGRIRALKNIAQLSDAIRKFPVPAGVKQPVSVGQIVLFKSTLTPQGPVYEPLNRSGTEQAKLR